MRILLAAILLANSLLAQTSTDRLFSATKTSSLSGAAEVVTIQHLANYTINNVTYSSSNVKFVSAYLYCSVACTVTLERNGTAATTTAFSPVNVNPKNPLAATTNTIAYSSSNVGTGTTINTYTIGAGSFISIDLSLSEMKGGVADNLTFRTNSITGSVTIQVMWYEL